MSERFGSLTVVGEGPREGAQRRRTAEVECDCGTRKVVRREHLRSGAVLSCGCHRRQMMIRRSTSHGLTRRVPEYRVWLAMRERCSRPAHKDYLYYGGRGIRVCERWQDFAMFYADMGARPVGHSIDRIDNDGDYTPGNCRWATPTEQTQNRRTYGTATRNGKA